MREKHDIIRDIVKRHLGEEKWSEPVVKALIAELGTLLDSSGTTPETVSPSSGLLSSDNDLWDQFPVAIIQVDLNGNILFANSATLRLSGYDSFDQLIGTSTLSFYRDPKARDEILQSLAAGKPVRDMEVEILDKNGNIRTILLNARAQDGISTSILLDITEEKANVKALAKAEKRYSNLIDWLSDGIIVTDTDELTTFVNKRFCEIINRNAKEVIGYKSYAFLENRNQRLIKDRLEHRKKGYSEDFEMMITIPGGKKRWVRVRARPMFDNGTFTGTFALVSDITKKRLISEDLRRAREELEVKVVRQTRELRNSNFKLKSEIQERKMAEFARQRSDKRFFDIFHNSPYAIFLEDLAGNVIDANPAAGRLHECSREELIGKNIRELVPDWEHENMEQQFGKMVKGELKLFESYSLTQSGKAVPVEITSSMMTQDDEPVLLLHVKDISERRENEEKLRNAYKELEDRVDERTKELKQANKELKRENSIRKKIEQSLKTQEHVLRMVLDNLPSMVFLKDLDGKYQLVNKTAADGLGTTITDMVGKRAEDFLSKEEVKAFRDQDEEVIRTKKEVVIREKGVNLPGKDHPGFYNTVKLPLLDDDGNVISILGVSHDITELKQAQNAIRESEELYRQIARNIPQSAIFVYNKDLRFVVAEASAVLRLDRDHQQVEGAHFDDIFPSKLKPVFKQKLEDAILGKTHSFDVAFRDRHFLNTCMPVHDQEGKIIFGMLVSQDVTELVSAQRELEKHAKELTKSNRELEQFAYVASHDLQEPLRTVSSYVQLLSHRFGDKLDSDGQEFVEHAVIGVKRMQNLIQDLLQYSRLNRPNAPFVKTDCNKVVQLVRNNLKTTIDEKGVIIKHDDLPTVMADETQLTQLFQNLLENAIKFQPEGNKPEIVIKAEEHDEGWLFSVSDNGIGIEPRFKEKVFQIFQRLHSIHEYDGTGIGLALCKKIVEQHGGRIWFESEPGKGTTFFFTLNFHRAAVRD